MLELAPSLLSANFYNLKEDLSKLKTDVKYIHLDVMDGNFVPNISFGPGLIKSLRPYTDLIFDTHLMIENPEKYVEDFVNCGSDIITFHLEATKHPHSLVQKIKSYGKKAGISLNPSSLEQDLVYLLEDLDLVLVMSVNPGFGGQKFIDSQLNKIENLRKIKEEKNYNYIIEVDGGIKSTNVTKAIESGAELIVSGSDVFKAEDLIDRVNEYYDIFKRY